MKARRRQWAVKTATGVSALALALAVHARSVPEPEVFDEVPAARVAQRGGVSLQQAVAMAQQRYNGQVVRAETVTRGGRQVHEIRILDDGRVRTVRIDAQSGQFM